MTGGLREDWRDGPHLGRRHCTGFAGADPVQHYQSMLRGRLLTESLRVGTELAVPDLRVIRVGRQDVSSSASATQPTVWTFIDFEAPDHRADQLATGLASALLPDDGWYANFEVGDEDVVVFANRVFRYTKGDQAAREEALAYGRAAGTPAHQLDW
jgi:hypothetical protein